MSSAWCPQMVHPRQSSAIPASSAPGQRHDRRQAAAADGNLNLAEYPQAGGHRPEGALMRYAVVIEKAGNGYSAYVPDLPGCVAAARTRAETEQLIREAIQFHLEAMREDGDPIPPPTTWAHQVEVA
jgi:predicted RNase H-like HicB family nuclease